ncbi:FecR family protein [Winogradskyella sp.]|jgi:ferric-dicitrate binding protein FerR (iron transport regulator)|uniref:FecR family protein n=1 Tax=Winogradskyella sp. TaxID=1883156 RepID=UPI0025EA2A94|nr:FecR family protein [Winogradskyella sp.]MCT4628271.1 FecR family protein [Winogradskyella sp.]
MKKENLHNSSDTFLAKWLEGELTDKELKHLVSEEDYFAYLKLREGFNVKQKLDASTDASFMKIKNRIEKKQPKVKPLYTNWVVGIAASIVILFGLFTFLNDSEVIIETGYGENRTIALLDGSEVILNSKSKIIYDEEDWENDRKLYLEGEAYFKVAKGETFVVNTNNGSVSVLGTQFNVNTTNGFFEVVCYEGKVQVKTKQSKNILLPNNAARSINESPIDLFGNSERMPAWVHGESTFKSVPIRYVIKALEDKYNVAFNTEAIDDSETFTGSFPHDSLSIALKTVFETLNITYNEKEKRNIKLRYKE